MLKRFVVIMAVLTTCLSGAYAQTAKDVKVSATVKKRLAPAMFVRRKPAAKAKENRAIAALIASLTTDTDRLVRRDSAMALGKMKDARSAKALVRELNDVSPAVRKSASEALKKIGTPAIQPLTAAMSHRNPIVRRRAAALIGEISRAAPTVARSRTKEKDKRSALHANASGAASATMSKKHPSALN
jgi:HEAT repeat protein